MNGKLILCLIIIFALQFGTIETFAQERAKRKEVIIVEFSLFTGKSFYRLEFPINKTSKGKLDFVGGMVNECGLPSPECAKSIYSSYYIYGRAFATGKNQAKIKFKADITANRKDCEINQTYRVYRNRKTKITLNSCGANLIAYYGFKSRKTY